MSFETVTKHCATLRGAGVSQPFGEGHYVWKVGNKIFAIVGFGRDGVSIKCADIEAAQMLIEMGIATRAPYLHRSWALLMFDRLDEAELNARITHSYNLIFASLTKKAQAAISAP